MPAISVEEFVERSVKKHASRVAMKVERDGKWISWTYEEYLKEIKTAAKAFIKVSVKYDMRILWNLSKADTIGAKQKVLSVLKSFPLYRDPFSIDFTLHPT